MHAAAKHGQIFTFFCEILCLDSSQYTGLSAHSFATEELTQWSHQFKFLHVGKHAWLILTDPTRVGPGISRNYDSSAQELVVVTSDPQAPQAGASPTGL
jgi:hypothetical protein